MTKFEQDCGVTAEQAGAIADNVLRCSTLKTPTLDDFKSWAKAHHNDAIAVCMAQAFAECERERVDAYIKPIFESFGFVYGNDLAARIGLIGPLPWKDLYLCDDMEMLARYWKACDTAHRAHGFTGPDGYCPALIAEDKLIKAQNKFLRLGCDLFGLEDIPSMSAHRAKMLDLLLGACLIKKRDAA